MPIVNGHPAECGCYVEGHWGQYGPDHLADQAEGFGWTAEKPTDDPRAIRVFADEMENCGYRDAAGALWEFHSEAADDIVTWLNEHTTPSLVAQLKEPGPGIEHIPEHHGYVWHWHDGEFFLSPICDPDMREECTDDTCAHWD